MSKPSQRVEQDELRARMRAAGMTHDEIAVEFARRYRLRPRAAHRVAHGWTQQQAADRINTHTARIGLDPDGAAAMTAPRLSELENWPFPPRRPTPRILALLADVYGTDIHNLLDLDDHEQMPPADMLLISRSIRGNPSSAAVDATTVVDRPSGGAFDLAAAVDRSTAPDDVDQTADPWRTGRPLEIVESAAGRRVGADFPEQLRRRTARLRRLDDVLGGGATYRLYLAEYEATAALVQEGSYTEATGRALVSVLAEQAQQAGWAAFDAGNHTEARRLYETSRQYAAAADDTPLAGNALAYRAYQTSGADHRSAVGLAIESCQVAGSGAPRTVRALLHARLAWTYAVAGDARETERALRRAEEALAADDEEPQPDWAAWVDRDELAVMTGRCWAELRRPLRAVPVLEDVLGRFDDTHARDKSLYLSWLADAYLAADEVEHAAAVVERALDLSSGIASVRPRQRIMLTLHQLDRYRALPPVAATFDKAHAWGVS
ncbi:helix-turn-helix domain-containing protein [Protofrankia symbiont of Coriaria ruscifolia]|uniref:helix-turn-helix domain-containing protein n=1 Tax=Protofrankia symbiont of Coriaria ruscifolia TaxID=1306542 RepID=UPI001F5E8019|nr:helix-turn-helix domain-containing protein [Protofrankia symbiont of Coriaria ruscifolia]